MPVLGQALLCCMKFQEYLLQHMVPEWASQYVDYKGLKELIDVLSAHFPRPPLFDPRDESSITHQIDVGKIPRFAIFAPRQLSLVILGMA
eukprot:m.169775 g.169775  ORF g.169775 m.169775 type:complete len:90 (-) comp53234_c1_seq4:794-1063(-)